MAKAAEDFMSSNTAQECDILNERASFVTPVPFATMAKAAEDFNSSNSVTPVLLDTMAKAAEDFNSSNI
eukprot:4020898-Karenia_brevis.AAC.1